MNDPFACAKIHDKLLLWIGWPFKRQPHKMVKRTQRIRLLATNCLSVFDHFVGLAYKGLKVLYGIAFKFCNIQAS